MAVQKQAVVELVETHRGQGRSVGEVLGSVGVARSNTAKKGAVNSYPINLSHTQFMLHT
jgi:hypothetical protein